MTRERLVWVIVMWLALGLALATQGDIHMTIDEDGEIEGYIVTPASYHITVNTGDGFSYSFAATVTEAAPADPLTLQAILAAS